MSLLDDRIKEFNLPPCPYQPAFDRFVLVTIPEPQAARDTFVEGGLLVTPESVRDRQKKASPRGVIVAAGLTAMDQLRGHGIGLGSIVWVARFSPWRHEVEKTKDGFSIEMMFLRASDVVGCEDTLKQLHDGELKIVYGEDGKHRYEASAGAIPRFDPPEVFDQ